MVTQVKYIASRKVQCSNKVNTPAPAIQYNTNTKAKIFRDESLAVKQFFNAAINKTADANITFTKFHASENGQPSRIWKTKAPITSGTNAAMILANNNLCSTGNAAII